VCKAKLPVQVVTTYNRSGMARFFSGLRADLLMGSDALRLQLKELIPPHLPEYIELSFSGVSLGGRLDSWNFSSWLRRQQPAVFILVKNVAYRLTPEQVARLKEKAIAVGVDHKDGDISKIDLSIFDFHISSTQCGLTALNQILAEDPSAKSRGIFAGLLHQSYDTRLEGHIIPPNSHLSPVYLGWIENAEIPRSLVDKITVFNVELGKDMGQALKNLAAYNFHFAVRPTPKTELRRSYKPFTKGATAAACRSNILVNRQVDDAVEFLTSDYPYFVPSNSAKDVEEGYRKAQDEFGGPEWKRGLEIMRSVRERVSGKAQAKQFVDIVTRAAEMR
jgi:hypothetical protein